MIPNISVEDKQSILVMIDLSDIIVIGRERRTASEKKNSWRTVTSIVEINWLSIERQKQLAKHLKINVEFRKSQVPIQLKGSLNVVSLIGEQYQNLDEETANKMVDATWVNDGEKVLPVFIHGPQKLETKSIPMIKE